MQLQKSPLQKSPLQNHHYKNHHYKITLSSKTVQSLTIPYNPIKLYQFTRYRTKNSIIELLFTQEEPQSHYTTFKGKNWPK